jgi:23S rRNA (cytosine1962-C5)-methyltransferase
MSTLPTVRLHPRRELRIAGGHPWIFSNEIDGDIKGLPQGGAVEVVDSKGRLLGRGYANPRSLIAIRLLTTGQDDVDAPDFYVERLRRALALRELVYPGRRSLRLVFGESDGLPGLVIDRYDDVLAVQISTLGMEVRLPVLEAAVREVFAPRAAVLRNEAQVRELEGLPREKRVWFGEPPERVPFEEFGVQFEMSPLGGQKTGHFFDQADNKRAAAPLCRGRSVLDVYANSGGWALHALAGGATSALVNDSDPENCRRALDNAERNGFRGRLEVAPGDARQVMRQLTSEGRRFGAVVLDPPAFAKQKKAVPMALKGYREMMALGCRLVEDGGLIFASSCSWHVDEPSFLACLLDGARDARRGLLSLRRGEQAADHPVLTAAPETRYLKSFTFRVT